MRPDSDLGVRSGLHADFLHRCHFSCRAQLLFLLLFVPLAIVCDLNDPLIRFFFLSEDQVLIRLCLGIWAAVVSALILFFGLFAMLVRWLVERSHRLRHEG